MSGLGDHVQRGMLEVGRIAVQLLPPKLTNDDTLSIIFAILCLIGAWVVLTWVVKCIVKIVWPLLVVTLIMSFSSTWKTLSGEVLTISWDSLIEGFVLPAFDAIRGIVI